MLEYEKSTLEEARDTCIQCGLCTRTGCDDRVGSDTVGTAAERVLELVGNGENLPYDLQRLIWGCNLCDGCTVSCPVDIAASRVYAAARNYITAGTLSTQEFYRPLRTDLANNTFSLIRQCEGTVFEDDLLAGTVSKTGTLFFAGCSLATYAPRLTLEVYEWLGAKDGADTLTVQCCGKTLLGMGAHEEFEVYAKHLVAALKAMKVKRLITACPNCLYTLRDIVVDSDIEVVSLPYVLALYGREVDTEGLVPCVHDSCPDRTEGLFSSPLRSLLETPAVPMTHEGRDTICCGSGGQVGYYDPTICDIRRDRRLAEARDSGADVMVCACVNCVNTFSQASDAIPTKHYLEYVFDTAIDWSAAGHTAERLARMDPSEVTAFFASDIPVFAPDENSTE